MVIFNACYNGSFHNHEGYVAGCHVFSDGDCIVAQGNTVNVLQDKWEDKLMGIMSLGERVGMWQKEVPYLEGHMIGDPTYRFDSKTAEDAKIAKQLHHDLVFNRDNEKVWKKYLKSDNSVLRAVAITYLGYIGNADPCSCFWKTPLLALYRLVLCFFRSFYIWDRILGIYRNRFKKCQNLRSFTRS